MAYSLYIDRNENFECDVNVKNASLKDAIARLIIKSDDLSLMFEGDIHNGRCVIPITKMNGLLKENVKGKMHLEIIVDNTYFNPWHDDFVVEEHTSVKVVVKEQTKNKPVMKVLDVKENKLKIVENTSEKLQKPIQCKKIEEQSIYPEHELCYLMKRFKINKKNLISKKSEFNQIIKEYFLSCPNLIKDKKIYINKMLLILK